MMEEKKVFVIGEISKSFTEYLEDNKIFYRVLQSTVATRISPEHQEKLITANFEDEDKLRELAREIQAEHNFNVTITEFENYIYYASIISGAIGLKSISPESAIACTDKGVMRSKFSESTLDISPNFATISDYSEATLFAEKYGYPVVIKAAGLAKSLLVMICEDELSLANNCRVMFDSIAEVYARIAPLKTPKVIIEEFMEGSVHSVEGYCDDNDNFTIIPYIVDCTTGRDIGRDDNYHYKLSLPSKLTDEQKARAYEVCEEGMRMLGMKNSAAHIEFIMTAKGPKLIEIGARNGGYRSRMYELANGLDIYNCWLETNSGKLPLVEATKSNLCCEIDLVPERSGVYAGISNLEHLEKLESLKIVHVNSVVGEKTGRASDGYRPCAYMILSNENAEQMKKDVSYVDANVSVLLSD